MTQKSIILIYRCGHHLTYRWLSSKRRPFPNKAAESAAVAEASIGYCRECARKIENNFSAQEARLADLPSLSGTREQIVWANTIRSKLLPKITDALAVESWTNAWRTREQFREFYQLRRKHPEFDVDRALHDWVDSLVDANTWINMSKRDINYLIFEMALEALRGRDESGERDAFQDPIIPAAGHVF